MKYKNIYKNVLEMSRSVCTCEFLLHMLEYMISDSFPWMLVDHQWLRSNDWKVCEPYSVWRMETLIAVLQ